MSTLTFTSLVCLEQVGLKWCTIPSQHPSLWPLLFINQLANIRFSIQANPNSHVISGLRSYLPSTPLPLPFCHSQLINYILLFHKLPSFLHLISIPMVEIPIITLCQEFFPFEESPSSRLVDKHQINGLDTGVIMLAFHYRHYLIYFPRMKELVCEIFMCCSPVQLWLYTEKPSLCNPYDW